MQSTKVPLLSISALFLVLDPYRLTAVAQTDQTTSMRDIWHQDMGSVMIGSNMITPAERDPFFHAIPANSTTTTTTPGHSMDPMGGFRSRNRSDRLMDLMDAARGHRREDDHDLEPLCDFGGGPIRVAVSPQPPLVNCQQDLYGDWLCNGSNIELINVLERRLNFQANWIVLANNHFDEVGAPGSAGQRRGARPGVGPKRQEGGKAGSSAANASQQQQPRSSAGIFGLVATGRALLSANGVMKTLDRQKYNLLVSEPFDSFKLHFLLSKSVRDHDHIFVKPFDLQAWLAIFVSAALVVPVFYLINSTSAHYATQDDHGLASISWLACLRYWLARLGLITKNIVSLKGCAASKRRRRKKSDSRSTSTSSSSTDSSLDEHVDRMMMTRSREGAHHARALLEQRLQADGRLTTRGERRRRRRLLRRQWCLERRRARKVSQAKRRSGFSRMAYIVWYVVASLANQGGETEDLPHASSTRILVAFWWLYLIVICAIHSGILTAILTFPKQIDFIQTLDDYLNLDASERNGIRIAVDKFSELAHLLADQDNLHKSPLQQLELNSVPTLYVDFQRHRQRILDDIQLGHSALIEEKSVITQIITQEYLDSRQTKCLFKASRYPVDVIPMSLILSPKMSAHCVQQINAILRRVMITGLAQKWRRKYDSQGNDCLNSVVMNVGDVDKIELKHVTLAFWLLGLGVLVGLLFLVSEIVWLFLNEGEEDADDDDDSESYLSCSSDSSSSSSSDGSDLSSSDLDLQLGHRRAIRAPIQKLPMRTFQIRRARSLIRRLKHQEKVLVNRMVLSKKLHTPMPQITLSIGNEQEQVAIEGEGGEHEVELQAVGLPTPPRAASNGAKRKNELRQRRRLARAAERRSRRIQRTVDFIKRVHGGKIYSEKLKSRVRRASHAIVDTFIHSERNSNINHETHSCRLRNRLNATGRQTLQLAHTSFNQTQSNR